MSVPTLGNPGPGKLFAQNRTSRKTPGVTFWDQRVAQGSRNSCGSTPGRTECPPIAKNCKAKRRSLDNAYAVKRGDHRQDAQDLWVKAGGRCSICRDQLVTEGTDTDDPSVFGEEAHIVARGQSGPRAGKVTDIDAYDNLILLCRKHHKQVDD